VGDQYIDGRIILKWMQKKYVVRIWTGFMWFIVWSIEHLKEL